MDHGTARCREATRIPGRLRGAARRGTARSPDRARRMVLTNDPAVVHDLDRAGTVTDLVRWTATCRPRPLGRSGNVAALT